MIQKCPGQDSRNIKSESLICDICGYEIEIFSDELKVRCPGCKNSMCRKMLPSCIDWCKSARECIGENRWNRLY